MAGRRGDVRGAAGAMIIHGDCVEILSAVTQSVDAMITDPPYARRVHAKAFTMRGGTARNRDLGFAHLSPRTRTAVARWAATHVRRWCAVYSDLQGATWWRIAGVAAGLEHVRDVPWVRWSMPQLSGDRPPSGAEMLVLMHPPGRKRWSGPGALTHLAHNCMRGSAKHPTQKPLAQALDLVSWFTAPGEMVLDPFAGSGTTHAACALLGRECVAIECDARWVERARARPDTDDLEKFERWKNESNSVQR